MSYNRRVGRECALKMLYALKLEREQVDPGRLLDSFWDNFRFADDALGEPLDSIEEPLATSTRIFAETLVKGVVEYRSVLDRKISEVAKNWSLERMTPVDLSILRMSAYELLFLPEIPVSVSINEAIEIAKRYGTEESAAFINGLLDKIARNVEKGSH